MCALWVCDAKFDIKAKLFQTQAYPNFELKVSLQLESSKECTFDASHGTVHSATVFAPSSYFELEWSDAKVRIHFYRM